MKEEQEVLESNWCIHVCIIACMHASVCVCERERDRDRERERERERERLLNLVKLMCMQYFSVRG